tara:strand:- start:1300 stop:1458 length:159 start_codon:yes stop_codon:yes gene_type:complete
MRLIGADEGTEETAELLLAHATVANRRPAEMAHPKAHRPALAATALRFCVGL